MNKRYVSRPDDEVENERVNVTRLTESIVLVH